MGQKPKYPDQHIERTIIEPLLAFRHKVGPLNATHNDNIQAFTATIMGLLTGSDGGVAMQGPGANALAEIVGHFLDGERQLAGSDPRVLEGRLLQAAIIGERYAQDLLDTLNGHAPHGHPCSASPRGRLICRMEATKRKVIPSRPPKAFWANFKSICAYPPTNPCPTLPTSMDACHSASKPIARPERWLYPDSRNG